jgi:hypothetical protein
MAKPKIIRNSTPQGTMREKLNEAKNRPYKGGKGGLPERVSRYGRGSLNTARTAEKIAMKGVGGTGRAVARTTKEVVTTTGKALTRPASRALTTAASTGAKATGRMASLMGGPIGLAAFELVTSATPAQAPAPARGERLMKSNMPSGYGTQTSSSAYGYKPKTKTNTQAASKYTGYGNKTSSSAYGYKPNVSTPTGTSFPKGKGFASLPKPRLRPEREAVATAPMRSAPQTRLQRDYSMAGPGTPRPKGNLLDMLKKMKKR